jgi:HSP20 family protein
MAIMRWDPFRELNELSNRVNRYFGQSERAMTPAEEQLTVAEWWPPVDIKETAEEFMVKAELPGMKKENVHVTINEGILTMQGERKAEKEEKGARFHRIERSYGSFARSFVLPQHVDETKVVAEFTDGVLNVRMPKSATAKPKNIEVKVG